MIGRPLLRGVVTAELLFLLASVVFLFGHGLWLRAWRGRDAPLLARARAELAVELDRPALEQPEPERAVLPLYIWERAMVEVAPSVRGSPRDRLSRLAVELGLVDRASRLCASHWWWRRLRGAFLLAVYDADLPVALFGDRHDSVRALAIEWAGDHPSQDQAERLIGMLADPSPLCRNQARDALLRCGPAATVPVARHLGVTDGPYRPLLLELAAWRPDPMYEPAALVAAGSPDAHTRARAATLLGALGGERAPAALVELATDDEPDVRAVACMALGRLSYRPAATLMGSLLGDPAWDVRKAAGEALAAMGAPGTLVLRRWAAGTGGDEYAADMARQVLELVALRSAGRER